MSAMLFTIYYDAIITTYRSKLTVIIHHDRFTMAVRNPMAAFAWWGNRGSVDFERETGSKIRILNAELAQEIKTDTRTDADDVGSKCRGSRDIYHRIELFQEFGGYSPST